MRKTDQLTIIACSGSILAAVLFSSSASAIPAQGSDSQNNALTAQTVTKIGFKDAKIPTQQSTQAENNIPAASDKQQNQQNTCAMLSCGCMSCTSAPITGKGFTEEQFIQPKPIINTSNIHQAPRQ